MHNCKESEPIVYCETCSKPIREKLVENLSISFGMNQTTKNYVLKFDCPFCLSIDQMSWEYFEC